MKNKGFTLIEIIVCLILITVIGSAGTIYLTKNNNNIDKTNKQIIDATKVFVELEKDENGDNYLKAINNYAKGVKIPLKTLEEKGYITDNIKDEIYNTYDKTTKRKNNQDYFVLVANVGESSDYCQDSATITITESWIEDSKPLYLCNIKNNVETPSLGDINLLDKIIADNGGKDKIYQIDEPLLDTEILFEKIELNLIENSLYLTSNLISLTSSVVRINFNIDKMPYTIYRNSENGLYKNADTYYYRGNINNNYIDFYLGGDVIGRARILNFNGNNFKLLFINGGLSDGYVFKESEISLLDIKKSGCITKNTNNIDNIEVGRLNLLDSNNFLLPKFYYDSIVSEEHIGFTHTTPIPNRENEELLHYCPDTSFIFDASLKIPIIETCDCWISEINSSSQSTIFVEDAQGTYVAGNAIFNNGVFYNYDLLNDDEKNQINSLGKRTIQYDFTYDKNSMDFLGGMGTKTNPYKIELD